MFVLSRNGKGNVAELEIATAAAKLGVPVLKPLGEHGRSDLAFEIGDRLWRVQCKWGRLSPSRDVVIVHLFTGWYTPKGYVRRTYTTDEIDLVAVYCGELDRCFLLPVSVIAGLQQIHLRLTPPRNSQRACITLANDFDFEGAVAQLGRAPAWHAGGQGFESPQLHSSTRGPIIVGCNPFRDHFGHWIDRAAAGEDVLVTRRGKPLVRLSPAAPAPPDH